jgi:MYXO-CTERM domain-containing protein
MGVAFFGTYFYVVTATVGPTTTGNSNEVSVMSLQPPPKRTTSLGGSENHGCGIHTVAPGGGTLVVFAGVAALLLLVRRR